MKKPNQRIAVYDRINHSDNMNLCLNSVIKQAENKMVFIDYATGVETKPALNKLLELVESNKIDVIITYSLTRFARKTDVLNAILYKIQKNNVKLVLKK